METFKTKLHLKMLELTTAYDDENELVLLTDDRRTALKQMASKLTHLKEISQQQGVAAATTALKEMGLDIETGETNNGGAENEPDEFERITDKTLQYHDLNILKMLCMKDTESHVYSYHGICIPGTDIEVTKVEIVNDMLLLHAPNTVQFWKQYSGYWLKIVQFVRGLPRGKILWSDNAKIMNDGVSVASSDLWSLSPSGETFDVVLVHVCVCNKDGQHSRAVVPIPVTGKIYGAAHSLLPDKSVVIAVTYKGDGGPETIKTEMRMYGLNDDMDDYTLQYKLDTVSCPVSALVVAQNNPNYILLHHEPYVTIYNLTAWKKYTLSVSNEVHELGDGHQRQLMVVEVHGNKGIFKDEFRLTFRSTDGIVQNIMLKLNAPRQLKTLNIFSVY